MERVYPSVQFEVILGEGGTVTLPKQLGSNFRVGQRVTVKVTGGTVSKRLRHRNVTEEDVEQIALLQLEERDHVLRFLEAEGALAGRGAFGKHAVRYLRGKR